MSLAAITLIVALTSEVPDGTTPAIVRALHVALGDDARVLVDVGSSSDSALLARAESEHAAVVGVVTWSEHQRRASIRFVRLGEGRWVEREIRFDTTDASSERGRTVGFAIASMFPEDLLDRSRATPPAEVASSPPPPLTQEVRRSEAVSNVLRGAEPTSVARAPEELRVRPLAAADRMAIELGGLAAIGVGGYGGGIGAELGLRIPLGAGFRARVGLGARAAEVAPAQASSRIFTASAGVAWQTWLDGRHRWFGGGRVDVMVQRHELVHLSSDDSEPDHQVRWLPAGVATLELGYRFTEQAAFFVASGAEVAFGSSDIFVRHRMVATMSPLRGLAEAGLRVDF